MSLFLKAIFAALMRVPQHHTDHEDIEARRARMMIVAESIVEATARLACADQPASCRPVNSNQREVAALLIGKGKFESGFAAYVHEGRCHDGPRGARCDEGRDGVARAHGPWQQWPSSVFPRSDWEDMHAATPEATRIAAYHAGKLLAGGTSRCKYLYGNDRLANAIAVFTGSCLRMPAARVMAQADYARKVMATLPDPRAGS